MAIYHGYDGVLTLGGVDLTDHCTEFEVVETYGELDTTALGDTHETVLGGLGSYTLTATLHQDQAAGEVYATLQPLIGTVAAWTGKATSAVTGAENRQISGTVLYSEFSHMHPAPGSLDQFSVTWKGSGVITIAVA